MRDPDIYRFLPGEPPRDADALVARYRRTSAGPPAPEERWWNWAVAPRAGSAAPFGTVESTLAHNGAGALLAYLFDPRARGHGYATEACRAALVYLRARAGTRVVRAFVDTRNLRSIALLERLGFERFETLVDADHFKGSPSDEYHYRLLFEPYEDPDGQAYRR